MQLKRDTEFSLRIIYYLLNTDGSNVASVQKISIGTRIPRATVRRLCKTMKESDILALISTTGDSPSYAVGNLDKTLFDVVDSVENQKGIFAVFDPSSEMYKTCENSFLSLDKELEDEMSRLSIRSLMT